MRSRSSSRRHASARRPGRVRSVSEPASRCSADDGSRCGTIARCSRSRRARLHRDRLPPARRSCSWCTTPWRCTDCRCGGGGDERGTRRDTSPSSPRYIRAQITTFCAMFSSHVTPTHWSRRKASASSDSVKALFHWPTAIAIMASARRDNPMASGGRRSSPVLSTARRAAGSSARPLG